MLASLPDSNTLELTRSLPARDRCAFGKLVDTAGELLLFGSRAAGVSAQESDWDLLFAGAEKPPKADRLDIVWRTPGEIEDLNWLGSELASHIAAFGVRLRGDAEWTSAAVSGEGAIRKKHRRLVIGVEGLWDYWDRIHPEFQRKHLKTIRREVQRLHLPMDGKPVPPTPLLDRSWLDRAAVDSWLTFIDALRLGNAQTQQRLFRAADLITSGLLK